MRNAFINTLTELAKEDKKIFLLTGDLGFSVFEGFRDKFPGRFFDAGIAEQNMIGVAAGMALLGKVVFVYSIIPFVTMRCLEQIRNDLCMQNLDVKIIGMGAGLYYGPAGPTHHAIEDISIMRSLPNMAVISPSCEEETAGAIRAAVAHKGPVYIRLGRGSGLRCNYKPGSFVIGKGVLIEDGKDITIISTGSILGKAKGVSEILKKERKSVRLINIHTIKPIDEGIILKAARETRAIFAIEEHSLIGGLGSAVSEILAESDCKILFKRLALPDKFEKKSGSQECLCEKNDLSTQRMASIILNEIKRSNI